MEKKVFVLYSDITQAKLLAMAYTVKERKDETKNYTSGQWFSYELDPNNNDNLLGWTEELVGCRFPKIARERDKKGNIQNDERTYGWGKNLATERTSVSRKTESSSGSLGR